MLVYNFLLLFNWDIIGMIDEEMWCFFEEFGKMGFVFNFIIYGGY